MQRVAVALDFKKLPNSANLHELCGFKFYFFDIVEKLKSLWISGRQASIETAFAFEAEMTTVEHDRVDVAPDLSEIR